MDITRILVVYNDVQYHKVHHNIPAVHVGAPNLGPENINLTESLPLECDQWLHSSAERGVDSQS